MTPLVTSADDILEKLPSLTREESDLIQRAYRFAKEAHRGQKRYSGEPYFNHVFETALILADLQMSATTIVAGLLHDTIEDTPVTEENVREEFGEEILFLVNGVTKLGELKYRGTKRHVESLRKLLIATSQDIRVLIIKLADRLHNMRTLEFVPEEKQERIASETMEVYAPIAHRLGMGKIKGELEDLAFMYLEPEKYQKVVELSKQKYKQARIQLEKIHKKLTKKLAEEGIYDVQTDYRSKHIYSLYRKLERKDWDLDRVYDIMALRVIVPTISDCYKVLGVVHTLWRPLPGRIKDYIAFEKPNGYQSIHTTIFTGEGSIAEIQIRTKKMHVEAEYGVASHMSYKYGKEKGSYGASWIARVLPRAFQPEAPENEESEPKIPQWIQDLVEAQEQTDTPQEFIKSLRDDFFENRIFVFTPTGDVIDLPSGSSAIDFAYQIHTDIGNHLSGAKINGKLTSIGTTLHNGDIVEIMTSPKSKPNRKWLSNTKTSLARRKIKSETTDKSDGKSRD